ncbi:MAG: DNA-binding protein, partial [Bacteroidaceae bacterium]|nr:DNA-binding protein [Bacteroidaceae bacterium]
QIGISSKGAIKEEDWEESLIKKARINFRPGTVLQNILGNLTFTKVNPRTSKADKEAAADGEGDA